MDFCIEDGAWTNPSWILRDDCMDIYHIFFTNMSLDRHKFTYFLTVESALMNMGMNMGMHISL